MFHAEFTESLTSTYALNETMRQQPQTKVLQCKQSLFTKQASPKHKGVAHQQSHVFLGRKNLAVANLSLQAAGAGHCSSLVESTDHTGLQGLSLLTRQGKE